MYKFLVQTSLVFGLIYYRIFCMITIGVDITSIKRFEDKKINFIKKVLSDNEFIEYTNRTITDLVYVAQRWAIKEALFKANNNLHDYHLINIERDKKGIFKYKNYKISTSKENEYVIAFVIGEIKNDD